jgi:hypothetical protein
MRFRLHGKQETIDARLPFEEFAEFTREVMNAIQSFTAERRRGSTAENEESTPPH